MKHLFTLSLTTVVFALSAGITGCADDGKTYEQVSACGLITAKGTCDGSVVKTCQNNEIKTTDCAIQGLMCGQKPDSTFGCIAQTQQQCGNITNAGVCEGNIYKFCLEGSLKTSYCDAMGMNCGTKPDGTLGCFTNSTPQPPQNGCGNIPTDGICIGNTVKYCENNVVKEFTCTGEKPVCGSTGPGAFGCVAGNVEPPPQSGCGNVPSTGVCVGNTVKYCEDNVVKEFACTGEKPVCGSTGPESFGCVAGNVENPPQSGCGDVPKTGVCVGNTVKYCEDNVVKEFACTGEKPVCGNTEPGSFGCIAGGSPEQPPSALVTAEDWARARIAGTVSSSDAFNAITKMSGFPIITDDNTIIFMHWYEGGNWSVAGDFNEWKPQQMTNTGDIWYAEIPISNPTGTYYKFVKDGQQYMADPWASHYNYTQDGEISYLTKPDGWHLMRWRNIESPQGLRARDIFAYVPAGNGPYDVVYAHDGQNLFREGEGSWRIQDAMNAVHGNFVVVGIPHADEQRLSEYAHETDNISCGHGQDIVEAKGSLHAAYLQETIRPLINKQLPTTSKTGIMGSSMGGLISLYTAHLYPNDFKMVIAMSPTTAWGRFGNDTGKTIEDLYVEKGHRNFILYLDNGGYNNDEGYMSTCAPLNSQVACIDEMNTNLHDDYCFTRSFVDKMAEIGYTWEKDLFHWFEPNTGHDERAWRGRLSNTEDSPFILFMNAK